jgi:hypothetical protein
MKNIIIVLFITTITFSSCEKVIDLNLDTTFAQIVIQGNIYNQPGPYTIKLSQTVDFDNSGIYPPVSGAEVIISDNHGNIDTLTETTAGIYSTSKLTGTLGYTYTLTIISGVKTYTAVSTMPDIVNIDSTYTEKTLYDREKQVNIMFKDPADIENYYRIVEFINKVPQKAFYTISDELFDGKDIIYSIRPARGNNNNDQKLNIGNSVTVWLECVDKGVYDYFRTADEDMGQSASPSNPISNFSNGALGYFNACAVSSKTIVIK